MRSRSPLRAAILGVLGLAFATSAFGQAYQWEDEDGNLHFSDAPPASSAARALPVVPAKARPLRADGSEPIRYEDDTPSRRMRVERITVELDVPIGERKTIVSGCRYGQHFEVVGGMPLSVANGTDKVIEGVIEELGYRSPKVGRVPGTRERIPYAELSLSGRLEELDISFCQFDPPRTSVRLRVVWDIFDNLRREIVFSDTVEVTFKAGAMPLDEGVTRAIARATEELYTRGAVADLHRPLEFPDRTAPRLRVDDDPRRMGVRGADLAEVRRSAVSVRNSVYHTTGVVLSPGFVVAPISAVRFGDEVGVVVDGEEVMGRVIRRSRGANLALVQLERAVGTPPTSLSSAPAKMGARLIVVSAPPDDASALSVRQVTLSDPQGDYHRAITKVSPSDLGAPLFARGGELVGILSKRQGDTAYFTQIARALRQLDLGP